MARQQLQDGQKHPRKNLVFSSRVSRWVKPQEYETIKNGGVPPTARRNKGMRSRIQSSMNPLRDTIHDINFSNPHMSDFINSHYESFDSVKSIESEGNDVVNIYYTDNEAMTIAHSGDEEKPYIIVTYAHDGSVKATKKGDAEYVKSYANSIADGKSNVDSERDDPQHMSRRRGSRLGGYSMERDAEASARADGIYKFIDDWSRRAFPFMK